MTERTEIFVAYDDTQIYVAARLHDSSPDGIRTNSLYRDDTNGDDRVGIFLDTYDDNQNGLHFWINPHGIRSDALVSNDGNSFNADWDTFWDAAATRTPFGWTAELRIPFSSLGFDVAGDVVKMGLVAYRDVARKNERHVYPPLSPDRHIWTPSRAADITLSGVSAGKPVYVTPYLLAGSGMSAQLAPGGQGYDIHRNTTRDVGLDVKYNMTNKLTIDATVNTDFAQAEADDQQVNLTRFSLFFPEKRRFSQERSGLFQFRTANERLFHSRRIGLIQGQVIPILGGARLAGRAGAWDVGVSTCRRSHEATSPLKTSGWPGCNARYLTTIQSPARS